MPRFGKRSNVNLASCDEDYKKYLMKLIIWVGLFLILLWQGTVFIFVDSLQTN